MQPIELPHGKIEYGPNDMRRAVLIADDNAFVRDALYEFFEGEPDFQVCAVAENGRQAIEEARRLSPDLIVLDLAMPVMNRFDATPLMKAKCR
jgi:DNA-binding NarL/FixJ family response regulator